jgi:hypothetical protein
VAVAIETDSAGQPVIIIHHLFIVSEDYKTGSDKGFQSLL